MSGVYAEKDFYGQKVSDAPFSNYAARPHAFLRKNGVSGGAPRVWRIYAVGDGGADWQQES
jgi:hypothetical protein